MDEMEGMLGHFEQAGAAAAERGCRACRSERRGGPSSIAQRPAHLVDTLVHGPTPVDEATTGLHQPSSTRRTAIARSRRSCSGALAAQLAAGCGEFSRKRGTCTPARPDNSRAELECQGIDGASTSATIQLGWSSSQATSWPQKSELRRGTTTPWPPSARPTSARRWPASSPGSPRGAGTLRGRRRHGRRKLEPCLPTTTSSLNSCGGA